MPSKGCAEVSRAAAAALSSRPECRGATWRRMRPVTCGGEPPFPAMLLPGRACVGGWTEKRWNRRHCAGRLWTGTPPTELRNSLTDGSSPVHHRTRRAVRRCAGRRLVELHAGRTEVLPYGSSPAAWSRCSGTHTGPRPAEPRASRDFTSRAVPGPLHLYQARARSARRLPECEARKTADRLQSVQKSPRRVLGLFHLRPARCAHHVLNASAADGIWLLRMLGLTQSHRLRADLRQPQRALYAPAAFPGQEPTVCPKLSAVPP